MTHQRKKMWKIKIFYGLPLPDGGRGGGRSDQGYSKSSRHEEFGCDQGLGGRTIIKPVRTTSRRASLFPKCIIIYMEPFVLWSILIFPSGCAKEQNGVTDCSFAWGTLRGGAVAARQVNKVA